MHGWRERLEEQGYLITDGAWGTQLSQKGLKAGEAPELWNVERPDDVLSVAVSYVEAGSDIILTNTFGGSSIKLSKSGLQQKARALNEKGARLSRQAAGQKTLVFASIGPCGDFMEPLGTLSRQSVVDSFAEQIEACMAGGADAVVAETFTDLEEAKAALEAARSVGTFPVVVSMTYEKGQAGFATMMGVRPHQAAKELEEAGADAVGVNCGMGVDGAVDVVELLRQSTSLPIWAKPNAGLPQLVNGETVFKETPEQMAAKVPSLLRAGASHVGGCCGTTPAHLRAFVKAARNSRVR